MKIYVVGGYNRDTLLGLTPNDIDYCVQGGSIQEMLSLGFTEVGSAFPVFLHPETKDEYALCRTESSTGARYKDFSCYFGANVTLEEDLLRRDLTMCSIAYDEETQTYIDPYNGIEDINNKVFRHTSEAFMEDPIRVLRLARFYARFGSEWTIAPETIKLCDDMFKSGMLESLVPERVWKETEKALNTDTPSLYFESLKDYNIFPEIKDMESTEERNAYHPESNVWVHTQLVMDYAAKHYNDPEITWASFTHDLGKASCYVQRGNGHGHEEEGLPYIISLCDRLKVSNSYRELALLVCEHHQKVHSCLGRGSNKGMRPKSIYKLFQKTSALTKPLRFEKMLKACRSDAAGRGANEEQIKEFEDKPYFQKEFLLECLQAASMVDTKEVSIPAMEKGKSGLEIGEAIRIARISAIRGVQNRWK
jgi:tRNA nucleotidyltransferase (CCA-adding enzyme)